VTSKPAKQRIIFIDVDGTILEHGEHIAPSTVEAIRSARSAGHLVYLSTGRAAVHIHPSVTAIGFDGAVTNSGAYATAGDRVILDRHLPREATDRMLEVFHRRGIHYFLQTHDGVYASDGMTGLLREWVRDVAERLEGREPDPEDSLLGLANEEFPSTDAADLSDVAKAVFVSPDEDGLDRVREDLGAGFHIVPGSMPLPGSNGEINQSGTTKGSAIEVVLAHLGLDAADAVAIGDSWNDVEMFEVCGVSVAMGNAHAELKALADHVTTDVLDDGVWNAFEKLGLLAH
jgi:Cof subfamily protein (haloacid dehalogenase superfamily)